MPVNRYKLRNFDHHHDGVFCSSFFQSCDRSSDLAVSNSIYDRNRMITHGFIKSDSYVRLVSDVELAFSSDPSVLSVISPESQRNLRMSISHTPTPSASFSDSELIESVLPTYGVERSDVVRMAESLDSSFVSPDTSTSENPFPYVPTPESSSLDSPSNS